MRPHDNRIFRKIRGFGLIVTCGLLAWGCAAGGHKNYLLIAAAEQGDTSAIERLIREGADVNSRDATGWTPYLAASTNGHLEAMRVLRRAGAKTEALDLGFSELDER